MGVKGRGERGGFDGLTRVREIMEAESIFGCLAYFASVYFAVFILSVFLLGDYIQ